MRRLSGGCVESKFAKKPSSSSRAPASGFTMNRCAMPREAIARKTTQREIARALKGRNR